MSFVILKCNWSHIWSENFIIQWPRNCFLIPEGYETEYQWNAEMSCYTNDYAMDYIKSMHDTYLTI